MLSPAQPESKKQSPFRTLRTISLQRARHQIERLIKIKNSLLRTNRSAVPPILFEKTLPTPQLLAELKQSVERAQNYFLSSQDRVTGFWHGKLDDNITLTSELVFFYKILGLERDDIIAKCLKHIEATQTEDGGWSLYYGGPGDLSASIEAYFACCFGGMSQDSPALKKAERFIRNNGGIEKSRVFTKINLAFFGFYPWERIPIIPAELMWIPKRMPFNILEFSSWSRAVIIPLTIIFHHKPNYRDRAPFSMDHLMQPSPDYREQPKPKNLRVLKQISVEYAFYLANHYMVLFEKYRFIKPLRRLSLKKVEKWIVEHQNESGDWCGIIPAMMNSVIGLHYLGYPLTHDSVIKGIQSIERFLRFDGDRAVLQSTVSPIWDTAITGVALCESGYRVTSPTIIKAVNWLIDNQIRQPGDWAHKAKARDDWAAWAFEFFNTFYPDTDDSALVLQLLLALQDVHRSEAEDLRLNDTVCRGLRWLESMQCSDGGFGAFDKDNNQWFLNEIPFADLKSLLDPSTPDVTGHVLETFALAGYKREHRTIKRMLRYIQKSQEPEGCWYGRWGVNYIYGTSGVLAGLRAIREPMYSSYIQRSIQWLLSRQNPDGGWGETCASYDDRNLMGRGASTASQTAWALIGLLAADLTYHPSVEKGIRYLLQHQHPDGTWSEAQYTGTGFPRHFYLRYDLYRNYFPLIALGRYYHSVRTTHE